MSQEFPREATSAVSWAVPPGKPDPIFGTGATRAGAIGPAGDGVGHHRPLWEPVHVRASARRVARGFTRLLHRR